MFTASAARRLVFAVSLLVACGGGDLVLPGSGDPAAIQVVDGDGQNGRVGAALDKPVLALVSDAQGRPVAGVRVAFAFDGETDASVAEDSVATDADGHAAFQVTMGSHVGPVAAQVTVAAGSRTLSAPVTLTAVSADANGLAAVSGDSQSAPVGADLPNPLVVQVTDGFGNPIAGAEVTWTTDGGGSVSDAITETGSDGLASVRRTLGPSAGTQHTLASAEGLAGSPVEFTHTATAGEATVLEGVSGSGQSALVGTALANPLVVRAHDQSGNPVSGLPVTWVVGEGGGSLTPATGVTDAEGRVSTQWTLGGTPGRNTATAVASGIGTVGFTATAESGAPPRLTLETQPPTTAVSGANLSPGPLVQLRDPDGSARRLAGVNVSVALASGAGALGGTLTRATNGDGRVGFGDLVLDGPAGSYTLAFSASGYSGVVSRSIELGRAGSTTEITSDDPDPSDPGQPVRVRFDVRSPQGTPEGNVQVTSDDGASCSATVAAGECTLSLGTAGARTLTATYGGSAEFEGSSGTETHTVRSPAPPPPPPPPPAVPSATESSVKVKDDHIRVDVDHTDVTVKVRDAGGHELKGIVVTLSATGGGNSITPASVTTEKNGEAKFRFESSEEGTKTLTAVAGGVVLADHPTIEVRD